MSSTRLSIAPSPNSAWALTPSPRAKRRSSDSDVNCGSTSEEYPSTRLDSERLIKR